jgi:hypothetical protein
MALDLVDVRIQTDWTMSFFNESIVCGGPGASHPEYQDVCVSKVFGLFVRMPR